MILANNLICIEVEHKSIVLIDNYCTASIFNTDVRQLNYKKRTDFSSSLEEMLVIVILQWLYRSALHNAFYEK